MLTEFRSALADTLTALDLLASDGSSIDVWDEVPDDIAALPCIVLGYPTALPSFESSGVVFDRSSIVYVIGRRVEAGGAQSELVAVTDAVIAGLGGTRGSRTADGQHLTTQSITHRVVTVAGIDHDAYLITIESPCATC